MVRENLHEAALSQHGCHYAQSVLEPDMWINEAFRAQLANSVPASVTYGLIFWFVGTQKQDIEVCTQPSAAHCRQQLRLLFFHLRFQSIEDVEHVGALCLERAQNACGSLQVIVQRCEALSHASCS